MEAASHQGIRGHFPLADEGMALQHLDPRGPPEDGGEERRMGWIRSPRKRRIQRKEPRAGVVQCVFFGDQDVPGNLNASAIGKIMELVSFEVASIMHWN